MSPTVHLLATKGTGLICGATFLGHEDGAALEVGLTFPRRLSTASNIMAKGVSLISRSKHRKDMHSCICGPFVVCTDFTLTFDAAFKVQLVNR